MGDLRTGRVFTREQVEARIPEVVEALKALVELTDEEVVLLKRGVDWRPRRRMEARRKQARKQQRRSRRITRKRAT